LGSSRIHTSRLRISGLKDRLFPDTSHTCRMGRDRERVLPSNRSPQTPSVSAAARVEESIRRATLSKKIGEAPSSSSLAVTVFLNSSSPPGRTSPLIVPPDQIRLSTSTSSPFPE